MGCPLSSFPDYRDTAVSNVDMIPGSSSVYNPDVMIIRK